MILGVTAVRPSVRPPKCHFPFHYCSSLGSEWLVGWLVGGTLCRHFYFPRRNGRVGSRMGSRALPPPISYATNSRRRYSTTVRK